MEQRHSIRQQVMQLRMCVISTERSYGSRSSYFLKVLTSKEIRKHALDFTEICEIVNCSVILRILLHPLRHYYWVELTVVSWIL